jgi:hypothetical protein
MNENEKAYHSALSRCADLLDNMADNDALIDTPIYLKAKLEQLSMAGAADVEPFLRATKTEGGEAAPLNGIPATLRHGEGAIARCSYCKRYSLDPATLSDRQPVCDCGKQHGWSGSFVRPDADSRWSGKAPAASPSVPSVAQSIDTPQAAFEAWAATQQPPYQLHVRPEAQQRGPQNIYSNQRTQHVFEGFAGAHSARQAQAAPTDQSARIAELEKQVAVWRAEADKAVAWLWRDGAPPFPQDQEWFIAKTKHGRMVLRALPEEHSYDYTTADHTYIVRANIEKWAQFPDSEYIAPSSTEARATAPEVRDAARDVLAERQRQISVEGWVPERDDQYVSDELAQAAACYVR